MNLSMCYCHCPMFVSIYSRDRNIDWLHQTIIIANTYNVMKGRNKMFFFYFMQSIRVNLTHVCWMFKVMQNLFPNSTQSCRVFYLHQFFKCLHIYHRAQRIFVISVGDHTVQAHWEMSHTICYCCRGFRCRVYATGSLFWNGHSCCSGSSYMNY